MTEEELERQMDQEMAEADAAERGNQREDTAPEEDFLEADASADATEEDEEPLEEYESEEDEVGFCIETIFS